MIKISGFNEYRSTKWQVIKNKLSTKDQVIKLSGLSDQLSNYRSSDKLIHNRESDQITRIRGLAEQQIS